jgi:hypothetical protein
VLADVTAALGRSPNLVLRAPTGAGTTTRVAPALLDAGIVDGAVLLLEPRRMAARAAARRIAAERGVALGGDAVGYHVRFDRKVTARTRLISMTYGIFLRRLQDDPFLDGFGAVLFDEIHERSLTRTLRSPWRAKPSSTHGPSFVSWRCQHSRRRADAQFSATRPYHDAGRSWSRFAILPRPATGDGPRRRHRGGGGCGQHRRRPRVLTGRRRDSPRSRRAQRARGTGDSS